MNGSLRLEVVGAFGRLMIGVDRSEVSLGHIWWMGSHSPIDSEMVMGI